MQSIALIGHTAIDTIITSKGSRQQLGGPPTYSSLITHVLETPLDVRTKIGDDFPDEYFTELAGRGINIRDFTVQGEKTTHFKLDYTTSERRMSVPYVCAEITTQDLRNLPDSVMVTPIIGEIDPAIIRSTQPMQLALDPQGFVRERRKDGKISFKPWLDRDLLREVTVLKSSEREISLIAGDSGWKGLEKLNKLGVIVAIETLGERGSKILTRSGKFTVPAYMRAQSIDPTGAGDAYLAGFFTEYVSGNPIDWCAAVGSASASAIVETIGPLIKTTKEEILERANIIQNEVVRIGTA